MEGSAVLHCIVCLTLGTMGCGRASFIPNLLTALPTNVLLFVLIYIYIFYVFPELDFTTTSYYYFKNDTKIIKFGLKLTKKLGVVL